MDELDRIRKEYERRRQDLRYRDWYSPFSMANAFIVQERDREFARLLDRRVAVELESWRVLDVGCGSGDQLIKLVGYGISPHNLFGIDLLGDRVQHAKAKFGNLQFIQGDAAHLPCAAATFDLVLQFTVFTSILDNQMRQNVANEMLRVLKPQGQIVWYDYRLNPTNPQTRGIEKSEIQRLFPNCDYIFLSITLAPPLARWVAPRSWLVCTLLNQLPFLKTHYLAAIRKRRDETRC